MTCGIVVDTTISFLFISGANAQSAQYLNPSLVPTEGKTVQDFVTSGYKIQDKLEGDINSDRQLDSVLTVIEAGTQTFINHLHYKSTYFAITQ